MQLYHLQGELLPLEDFSWLTTPDSPLVFHSILHKHVKAQSFNDSNKRGSLWNPGEVAAVLHYLNLLLKNSNVKGKDIGVITPYRLQSKKIKDALENIVENTNEVLVASTQKFQGQERQVIILSTVRSSIEGCEGGNSLGFLTSAQRFNVAVTRARSLLIVIGDHRLLQGDTCWGTLINQARRSGNNIVTRVNGPLEGRQRLLLKIQ